MPRGTPEAPGQPKSPAWHSTRERPDSLPCSLLQLAQLTTNFTPAGSKFYPSRFEILPQGTENGNWKLHPHRLSHRKAIALFLLLLLLLPGMTLFVFAQKQKQKLDGGVVQRPELGGNGKSCS